MNVNSEGRGSLKSKSCKTRLIALLVEGHHLWLPRRQELYLSFSKSFVSVSGSFTELI